MTPQYPPKVFSKHIFWRSYGSSLRNANTWEIGQHEFFKIIIEQVALVLKI